MFERQFLLCINLRENVISESEISYLKKSDYRIYQTYAYLTQFVKKNFFILFFS